MYSGRCGADKPFICVCGVISGGFVDRTVYAVSESAVQMSEQMREQI